LDTEQRLKTKDMLDSIPANRLQVKTDPQSDDHLLQIQEILFGNERRNIDRRLEDLDQIVKAQVNELRGSTRNHVSLLESQFEERIAVVEQRVDNEAQNHVVEHSKLSAELCATFDTLEARIEARIERLSQRLHAELYEIREHLDVRTTEISLQFQAVHDRLASTRVERDEVARVFQQLADAFSSVPSEVNV